MIKLEKRLMQWCEDCEMFAPCSMKLREKQDDNSYVIKAVVMCSHADICSNAVHQYQKTLESTSIIRDSSPCKDCDADTASCCGCSKYFDWRSKRDD